MWQLLQEDSEAESLHESGWVYSWKKDLQNLLHTSTEDLAWGNLKLQVVARSGNVLGNVGARFSSVGIVH